MRLLQEEQSDQDLHCLPFHLHLFDRLSYGLISLNFRVIIAKILSVQKFRIYGKNKYPYKILVSLAEPEGSMV